MQSKLLYTVLSFFVFAAFWQASPVSALPTNLFRSHAILAHKARYCGFVYCRDVAGTESPMPLGTQNATNFTAPYAASEHNSTNGTIGDIAKSNSAFTQAVPSLFVGLALAAVAAAMQIVA